MDWNPGGIAQQFADSRNPDILREKLRQTEDALQAVGDMDDRKGINLFGSDALRTVCFARYEASQSGSKVVHPHHLLLGLLREGKALLDTSGIRDEVEQAFPYQSNWDKVNIRTSEAVKRIMDYAHEEARHMGSMQVNAGHLLLGILREEDAPGAVRFLHDRGLDVVHVRERLAREHV